MKRFSILFTFLTVLYFPLFGQQAYDVEPGHPAQLNGIDYGFEVRNERRIEISGESYMRYEVSVYATNRSNCAKIMFPKQALLGQDDQNEVASFDCLNATGKRLTSKGGKVMARPFMVPYRQRMKNAEGKEIVTTTTIQAGHILRNGETVNNSFIVIVPDGEAPVMKVRILELPDL